MINGVSYFGGTEIRRQGSGRIPAAMDHAIGLCSEDRMAELEFVRGTLGVTADAALALGA